MGINDRIERWWNYSTFLCNKGYEDKAAGVLHCADDLSWIKENCWHPVDVLAPTEEDGDDHGLVLMYLEDEGKKWIVPLHYTDAGDSLPEDNVWWARIRDVVLTP